MMGIVENEKHVCFLKSVLALRSTTRHSTETACLFSYREAVCTVGERKLDF